MSFSRRLKTNLHRWLDPVLAWRSAQAKRQKLATLPDGDYLLPFDIPYIPQFASPERINDYIHHGYDGTQDPNWSSFGAENPADYAFWSPRVCALACLKMSIMALNPTTPPPSLWQLVQEGLLHDGYKLHDAEGRFIDEGWYVAAQIALAKDYGLQMTGHSYASPLAICNAILQEQIVAATVSPEIGERKPKSNRYGGHLVLVIGFRWQNGQARAFCIHNPSGRYPELQAHAWIPTRRFIQSFAYRFATLKINR